MKRLPDVESSVGEVSMVALSTLIGQLPVTTSLGVAPATPKALMIL